MTSEENSTSNKQEPTRRNLLRSLRRNSHWKCLMITISIGLCAAYVVWCRVHHKAFAHDVLSTGPCAEGYNFFPVTFGMALYIVYIIECWQCRTRRDLTNKIDSQEMYDYVERLRMALPNVWWRALCYHYNRRTRQVTRYRNGDAISTTQVYYERVNSRSVSSIFNYEDCGAKDISKQLIRLQRHAITKLRVSKGFVFANLQAATEFDEQRRRFFLQNQTTDDYMEVREGLDFVDVPFKDHMITFCDPARRPWFTSHGVFWLLSVLLLTWPLRVLIDQRTAHVHYQVTKLFGTNYLSPGSVNYTGPLTRTRTMDSGELLANAANYYTVPSYSQALLLDPISSSRQVMHDSSGNVHIETRQQWRAAVGSDEALVFNNADNQLILPNYGALTTEDRDAVGGDGEGPSMTGRSRSRSLFVPKWANVRGRPGSSALRSVSFGSLSAVAARCSTAVPGGPYRTLNAVSPEQLEMRLADGPLTPPPDLPEEPPPTYEIALRMCAPLYERLRLSASSSLQRLSSRLSASVSQSSSRGLNPTADDDDSAPLAKEDV